MIIVVMGVAGSGKSTVGRLFADAPGIGFLDGDSLHPAENVRKMASGIPLTDSDRAPWLAAIRVRLEEASKFWRNLRNAIVADVSLAPERIVQQTLPALQRKATESCGA